MLKSNWKSLIFFVIKYKKYQKVKFEIDESGKIIGKVKENTKETRKLVSTAVAELIIMIQTGIEKVNYIMIILTLLVTISSLLYIVKKVNVKES